MLHTKNMPGIQIKITDNCTGCGTCSENICFVNAINVENDKATISKDCKICGRCAEVCPNKAIQISIKDKNFIIKTIERIKSSVIVTEN